MRAYIKNYLEAEKARREEDGERGFSLIELIVVVIILGILVAVAIPIFLNLQQASRDAALDSATSSYAVVVAGELANDPSGASIPAAEAENESTDYTFTVSTTNTGGVPTIDNFCVLGEATPAGSLANANDAYAGPNKGEAGCTAPAPAN